MKLRFFIGLVLMLFVAKSYSEDMPYHYVASSKEIPILDYIIKNKRQDVVMYLVTDPMATDTIVISVSVQYTPVDTIKGTYQTFCGIFMVEKSHGKPKSAQKITCTNDTTIKVQYTGGNPNETFKSIQAREVKNIFELANSLKITDLDLLKDSAHFPTNLSYMLFGYIIVPQ